VLEPYFLAAQERFVEYERRALDDDTMARVELLCAPWKELHEEHGFEHRNFAATSEDGGTIVVAPELAELPPDNVAAIIAHEFAHALDYRHPARFVLVRGEVFLYEEPDPEDPDGGRSRLNRMRQWIDRDTDTVEASADEIACVVLGREIRYSGPCSLQTFETGTSRPRGLR
jgi:hypothetical protein